MTDHATTRRPPGPIGRIVRLGLGAILLYGTWNLIRFGPAEIGEQLLNPVEWLVHMGIALWLAPAVVEIGWSRTAGQWIRPLVLGAAGILSLTSWLLSGEWWGPIVGWPVLLLTLVVFAHSGLSFAISGLIATPGCEMRAIPHLTARLSGGQFTGHACPGAMGSLDRWESTRRDRARL